MCLVEYVVVRGIAFLVSRLSERWRRKPPRDARDEEWVLVAWLRVADVGWASPASTGGRSASRVNRPAGRLGSTWRTLRQERMVRARRCRRPHDDASTRPLSNCHHGGIQGVLHAHRRHHAAHGRPAPQSRLRRRRDEGVRDRAWERTLRVRQWPQGQALPETVG